MLRLTAGSSRCAVGARSLASSRTPSLVLTAIVCAQEAHVAPIRRIASAAAVSSAVSARSVAVLPVTAERTGRRWLDQEALEKIDEDRAKTKTARIIRWVSQIGFVSVGAWIIWRSWGKETPPNHWDLGDEELARNFRPQPIKGSDDENNSSEGMAATNATD